MSDEVQIKDLEEELRLLRAYRARMESDSMNKAFSALEKLMDIGYDPLMSRACFRVIGACLMALRDKVEGL